MPTLDRAGDVYVLRLGADENRLSPDFLAALNAALDEVAAAPGPRALVTTADGKFFSNGLDLDWLGGHLDQTAGYVRSVQALLARVLTFPAPTVAALQGHTFAAGAMLALAHDSSLMRADRGFWCLPEADINIPFTPGMSALIASRLTPAVAHEAMLTGRRYGGVDAAAAGIVAAAVDADTLTAAAVERVAPHAGKRGSVLGTIKTTLFAPVLDALAAVPDTLALGG